MDALALPPPADPLAVAAEAAQLRAYLDASQAPATRRAYRKDWADFTTWCAARALERLPASAETVARYVADLAQRGRRPSTIRRRLSAIAIAHQAADCDSPTTALLVRKALSGVRRTHGAAEHGKAPLLPDDLRLLLEHVREGLPGLRDRALILLGFAGAFRRSELVSLDVGDVQVRREGLAVTLRRSKTDQAGEGITKGIPRGKHAATCPARAVQAWISEAQLAAGPLFRSIDRHGNLGEGRLSDKQVARLIKQLAEAAGLDPAAYSGHSLRAGLATAAAQAGAEERDIMRQTGHKSERMVRRYIREAQLFQRNAAGAVDL